MTLTLIGLCLGLVSTVSAAELAGVAMSDRTKVGDQSLVLNGLGLRKKAIFKVYVAGLYLAQKSSDPVTILAADEPRMLVIEFMRSVGRDSLVGAWQDCLANNSGASAETKTAFGEMNSWMTDVSTGDRMAFTYEPGKGTTISVHNRTKGTIEGKVFADALYSCWIGDAPPSADFKEGLLGQ